MIGLGPPPIVQTHFLFWIFTDFCNCFDFNLDGMTDCSDSECCSHPICSEHIMCLASNDPVEVLLRKQPPSVTASFYQRVKFLIEENSVQSYAHMDEYSERWVISDFHAFCSKTYKLNWKKPTRQSRVSICWLTLIVKHISTRFNYCCLVSLKNFLCSIFEDCFFPIRKKNTP